MLKNLLLFTAFIGIFGTLSFGSSQSDAQNPQVVLETTRGNIVLELFQDKAPLSVGNFLAYVESGFYDGTLFHRVIPDFMIQGGGYTPDLHKKATTTPIKNEAGNGLKNKRGTIAMARTNEVHSATAQFFINHADNDFLDHTDNSPEGYGYCVFGKVIEGIEVVDAIASVKTMTRRGMRDLPRENVIIVLAKRR